MIPGAGMVNQTLPENMEINAHALTGSTSMDDSTAVLTLYDNGIIHDGNKAAGKLLCCNPAELAWRHISSLLPQLKETVLVKDKHINPYLHFLSHMGHHFEVVTTSGVHFLGELFFSEVENPGRHLLRLIITPIETGKAAA